MNTSSPRVRRSRNTAQRIREYLDREYARPESPGGVKLPPIQKLAAQFNASTSTVYHVFRELRQEGRLRSKPGDGTYLEGAASRQRKERQLVGLSFPTPESENDPLSLFGSRVLSAMQREAMKGDRRMAIVPLPALLSEEEARKQLIQEIDFVDGMVLAMTHYVTRKVCVEIRQRCEDAGKPCMTINPLRLNDTVNFVSPDYFGALHALGECWWQSGRRRPAIMIDRTVSGTASTALEIMGLQAGIEAAGALSCEPAIIRAAGISESNGYEAMTAFLRGKDTGPDALFCFGGPMALGAIRACRENGLRVPQDISIVGGTASPYEEKLQHLELSRLDQPCVDLGRAIVESLAIRMAGGNAVLPGRYLPMGFILGTTTRPEENELLSA